MFICKRANLKEIKIKDQYEIDHNPKERDNWIFWTKQAIYNHRQKYTITYVGLLNGKIITQATAMIAPDIEPNVVVSNTNVYLMAFRTIPRYQGKGYFSKLHKFMLADLKKRGYLTATVGVEPHETKNKEIYFGWGYTDHVCDGKITYPDDTKIDVEYYQKKL